MLIIRKQISLRPRLLLLIYMGFAYQLIEKLTGKQEMPFLILRMLKRKAKPSVFVPEG